MVEPSITYGKMLKHVSEGMKDRATCYLVRTNSEAHERIRKRNFEIVVVDVEVDHFLSLVQHARKVLPRAIILVTARPSIQNERLCEEAQESISLVFMKPLDNSYQENISLLSECLEGLLQEVLHQKKTMLCPYIPVVQAVSETNNPSKLVVLASSTGGPKALEVVLSQLKEDYPLPIVVVQHTLPNFTDTLAQGLAGKTELAVKIAETNEELKAGVIYIAPSGRHILLDESMRIQFDDGPLVNGVKPAADVLFESIASGFKGNSVLVVILTGMGRDGASGVKHIKDKLICTCVAQNEATCTIYGMPRAVIECGLADRVVGLESIHKEIELYAYQS